MPRPITQRTIEGGPVPRPLKPIGVPMRALEVLTLTLDGVEALRLADIEGLYHEEAALRMGVSRATFGRILEEARRTLADGIVNGKAIVVERGNVAERPPRSFACPVHGKRGRRGRRCRCAHRCSRNEETRAPGRGSVKGEEA